MAAPVVESGPGTSTGNATSVDMNMPAIRPVDEFYWAVSARDDSNWLWDNPVEASWANLDEVYQINGTGSASGVIAYKYGGVAEPSFYTFGENDSTTEQYRGAIARITGVHPTTPFGNSSKNETSTTDTPTALSIIATSNESIVVISAVVDTDAVTGIRDGSGTLLPAQNIIHLSTGDGSGQANMALAWVPSPGNGVATDNYTFDLTTPDDVAAWQHEIMPDAVAGSTIPVNQVTETDTAQPITVSSNFSAVLSQVTETDSAQTITVSDAISLLVGQVSETDSAQVITPLSSAIVQVAQVTEVNTAQAINALPSAGQFHNIFTDDFANLPADSFAVDEDLSEILTGDGYQMDLLSSPDSHQVSGDSLGVITLGGVVTQQQTVNYTIYDLSDGSVGSAGTITINVTAQNVAVGQVVETNTAQSISFSGSGIFTLGQVSETDSAQPITVQQTGSTLVNQVVESDTAQSIGFSTDVSIPVGQVTENDTAQSLTPFQGTSISVGQVVETNTAQVVSPVAGATSIGIGQVLESDVAQPVTLYSALDVAIGQVSETDIAQAVTFTNSLSATVNQALEVDTAQVISPVYDQILSIGQVVEINSALPITVSGTVIPIPSKRTVTFQGGSNRQISTAN